MVIDLTNLNFKINKTYCLSSDDKNAKFIVEEIEYLFLGDRGDTPNSLLFIKDEPEEIIKNLKWGDRIKVRSHFKDLNFLILQEKEKHSITCEGESLVKYNKKKTFVDPHCVINTYALGVEFAFNINREDGNYETRLWRWITDRKQQVGGYKPRF